MNIKKTVILPRACYDWVHLRFQDFKAVSEYNSPMFKITSQLTLYEEKITDEEMLEKTFYTFHASKLLLQQQYRERGFKKYCDLISCLLVQEQNNVLVQTLRHLIYTMSLYFNDDKHVTCNT